MKTGTIVASLTNIFVWVLLVSFLLPDRPLVITGVSFMVEAIIVCVQEKRKGISSLIVVLSVILFLNLHTRGRGPTVNEVIVLIMYDIAFLVYVYVHFQTQIANLFRDATSGEKS